ncbi:hypothetical protein BCR41DRAFT_397863 [Lobosporangium transversale]|uniref:Uncharacterized protein n=1 Tax=Lobosporangium transversale TaxID=64571 RepID=A0A1Y2GJS2_9FUNG|nr:hypothetical protein BCR41DRAFT_398148 [Lobosporangium transversale]XP_021879815.1 hypothetical protein BCR41DRAFT_397863 [Lobosporangium transversale]ORZ10977.1 hypothetical protein BCR41DRAFT_398148 [Lobosporangium transversale]ORZ11718.1 hypothetical protein BCR41DRAFT_397863 [Lobosporangium transversale]|eukprot:XP_021879494.1 hypothetical protein BCR41DRAFT_398148 [Lobosporangium transversale]
MFKLNLNKPSHIMLTWAGLTVSKTTFTFAVGNKRAFKYYPNQTTEISWEERVAMDEANAAKKGYKVNYKEIYKASEEAAAESEAGK